MITLKASDLKTGDVIKVKWSKYEIDCFGLITEKIDGLFHPETFEPVVATIVNVMVFREDGSYFYDNFKLNDEKEYELVYRKEEKTE